MAEVTGDLGGQPIQLNNAATEATLRQLLAAMTVIANNTGKDKAAQVKTQKELERELKKLADAAKKQKAELRAAKKLETSASTPALNSKKLNLKLVAGFLVAGLLLFIGYSVLGNSENTNVAASEAVEATPAYSWSALISGESKAQTGEGTTFEVFVCDQNVIASSLEVKSISARSTSAGPLSTKVIKGDQRCGKAFDTIIVSAKEPEGAGSVNYFVTGRTSSNFDFRYDFSVTVLPN